MNDLKEHGGKVMTFVYKKPSVGMTYGKNYNVKESLGDFYSCIDDKGMERFILKSSFKNPLDYSIKSYLENFIDGKIGNTGLNLESEIIRNTSEILNTRNDPLILLSESGTKHDKGKLKPTLLLDDMPLAIQEILKVLQFGAKKYSEGNWLKVDNGINRYRNAADRHRLAIDELDDESGMMHLAHEATSILMLLELKLKEKRDAE